jgi:uncharacterized protein YecE (DUF72 family)
LPAPTFAIGAVAVMKKHSKTIWDVLEDGIVANIYRAQRSYAKILIDSDRLKRRDITNRVTFQAIGILCVDPFKNQPVCGDFQYFRLHGVIGCDHRYSDEELQQIREWAGRMPSYVMFSNTWMKEDALRLLGRAWRWKGALTEDQNLWGRPSSLP